MSAKPKCECHNDCGDDPGIDAGTVRPCATYKRNQQYHRLRNAAPDLLAAGRALLDLLDNHHPLEGTPSCTEQAGAMRAAIAKAEGRS